MKARAATVLSIAIRIPIDAIALNTPTRYSTVVRRNYRVKVKRSPRSDLRQPRTISHLLTVRYLLHDQPRAHMQSCFAISLSHHHRGDSADSLCPRFSVYHGLCIPAAPSRSHTSERRRDVLISQHHHHCIAPHPAPAPVPLLANGTPPIQQHPFSRPISYPPAHCLSTAMRGKTHPRLALSASASSRMNNSINFVMKTKFSSKFSSILQSRILKHNQEHTNLRTTSLTAFASNTARSPRAMPTVSASRGRLRPLWRIRSRAAATACHDGGR